MMFKKIKFSTPLVVLLVITNFLFISCSKDDIACKPDLTLQVETANTTEVSFTQANVYTDIIINAPAGKVWSVLRNFDNMPNWSSSLQGITGNISNGGSVVVKFDLGNGQVADISHSSFIYQEGVLFGWSDEVTIFPGIVDNHRYRVEAISDCQTRFIQTDEFIGTTAGTTPIAIADQVIGVYKTFNLELKAEVEK